MCVGDCSDPLNFVSKLSAGNTRRHKEQTAKARSVLCFGTIDVLLACRWKREAFV